MKALQFLVLLFLPILSISQDSIVDQRDGNTYQYYTIEGRNWMTENLRYLSPNSYCKAIRPKDEICEEYNFFPKQDLKQVCPEGWRVPTHLEWDELFAWYYKQRILLRGVIKLDTMPNESGVTGQAWYFDKTKNIDLFANENPLNFSGSQWVEGKKRIQMKNMTMWISDGVDNFHVHMGHTGVVKHNHKHHIEDKKRKVRQFVVRCVQTAENKF